MATPRKNETLEEFKVRESARQRKIRDKLTKTQTAHQNKNNRSSRRKGILIWPRRVGYMVSAAKHRDKCRGKESNIDTDFILSLLKKNQYKCAKTGTKLILEGGYDGRSSSPSIDRIDSNKGYTKNNVQVVCWWYNQWKSNMTDKEVLEKAKLLVSKSEEE